MKEKKWEILQEKETKDSELKRDKIIDILLANRRIKTAKEKKDFFNPQHPEKLSLKSLGINPKEVSKFINRLKKVKKEKGKVVVYGDYDADGICGTAVLWEALYSLGFDVWPYIPERFSEGYGLNAESVKKLKIKNEKLKIIITVDNGIVANKEIEEINKLGIDVIVTDHHEKATKYPKAYSLIHTTEISGSAIAWILAREILKKFKIQNTKYQILNSLDLVAIGTIADQVSLKGANRSFAKWGLRILNETKRVGLLAMFKEAALVLGEIGTYEVGFIIAPRINAMGRIEHGIDSLRILCTKSPKKAIELANILGKTNRERQRIVDEVVLHAKSLITKDYSKKVLILAHESYHEGVIGLAASKLVEEFHRPAIVISKGKKLAKGSARSISGFNIIENIRKIEDLLKGGGGHPMAAGFSIATTDIEIFTQRFEKISRPLLTEEVLTKKLKIDLELGFENLSLGLVDTLKKFEPFGIGNPAPLFATKKAEVVNARLVGRKGDHLKLRLRFDSLEFEAIAFNQGSFLKDLTTGEKIDIAYFLEKDVWGGKENLQLKIKDLRFSF